MTTATTKPGPPPAPPPPGPRAHRALASAQRTRLLALLRSEGPLEADELGARLGLHRNTVRAHIAVLRNARLVESRSLSPAGPGRPRVAFAATGMDPNDRQIEAYRMLARILAASLARGSDGRERAIAAGRVVGRELVATAGGDVRTGLLALLDGLGFAPQPVAAEGGGREVVELRQCPFHDLAAGRSPIVCDVHRGLLEGAAEQLGSQPKSVRLLPMVEPGRCHVRLNLP